MRLMIEYNHDELNAIGFQVLVECWDRIMGSASRKRKYKEAFTEKERAVIARYKPTFYSWYLVKGTPESAVMTPATHELLVRACNFFAEMY